MCTMHFAKRLRIWAPLTNASVQLTPCALSGHADVKAYVATQLTPVRQNTTTSTGQGEARRSQDSWRIAPGTLVNISTCGAAVDIKAQQGWSDYLQLQSLVNGQTAQLQKSVKCSSTDQSSSPSAPAPHLTVVGAEANVANGGIRVTVPEKWISFNIKTAGGAVCVSRVVEASLTVHSGGGNVALGTIRTHAAQVDTRCSADISSRPVTDEAVGMSDRQDGSLKAGEVSGSDVDLCSGAGSIHLRRLVAQRGRLNSTTGPVHVGAVFGERLHLETGVGSLDIGTLDCSVGATVKSSGGSIAVHGLDGNADIRSGGGDVQVHLHGRVGHVTIDSSGGSVAVACSDDVSATVGVTAAHPPSAAEGISFTWNQLATQHIADLAAAPDSRPHRQLAAAKGSVHIEAGSGKVSIRRLGWMEALKLRTEKAAREVAAAEA